MFENHHHVFVLLCISFIFKGISGGIHEQRLLEFLFGKNYQPLERPVQNETEPIRVELGLTLQQIIDLDEKNQILHTNIWLYLAWNDYNLRWTPSDYGGITQINIPIWKIWKPDILMYNSANEIFDPAYPTNCPLTNDGSITWIPPGMYASTCSFDVTWFPFDQQACDMKFGSWTYDGTKINLTLSSDSGIVSSFIKNSEWTLLGVPAKRNSVYYDCCPDTPYIDITYAIKIKRRPLYYIVYFVLPIAMISAISLTMFILPPEGGKIGLGITILLSLVMLFLQLVGETLPPTSDAVPLIGVYFIITMAICSLSILFTILMLNYNFRSAEFHRMPAWVSLGVCRWLAFLLVMHRPGESLTKKSLLKGSLKIEEMQEQISDHFQTVIGESHHRDSGLEDGDEELLAIYDELRYLSSRLLEKEKREEISFEWQFAARVIDRLCMVLFTFFTVASSAVIVINTHSQWCD